METLKPHTDTSLTTEEEDYVPVPSAANVLPFNNVTQRWFSKLLVLMAY